MAALRALIIGPGGAGTAVMDNMKADGRAEPIAFIETRPQRREELAAQYPGSLIGDGDAFENVLAESKPDIVVDAGPDYLHSEHTVAALQAGCHVLIEKPMCTSTPEVAAILDAEKKAGKVVMVDYTMRYSHPWGTMMEAARAGRVGKVFYLGGFYIHDMYDWFAPDGKSRTPWRMHKDHPQNVLFGGGCHGLDLMLCIMGDDRIVEVCCYGNKMSDSDYPAEDCFEVAMKFASGVVGKIFVSTGCNRGDFGRMLEVYGAEGTLVDGKLLRRDHEPEELAQPTNNVQEGHGWNLTTRDFLDVIDGKKPNEMNTLFGARNTAVFDAAMQSMREGGTKKVQWFE